MAYENTGNVLPIAKTTGNADILNRAVACEQFFCKPVDSIVQNELIYGIKIRIVLKIQPMGVAERLS